MADATFPERKDKVLGRIRAIRGGTLNDSRFGTGCRREGCAKSIADLFDLARTKVGLPAHPPELSPRVPPARRSGSDVV